MQTDEIIFSYTRKTHNEGMQVTLGSIAITSVMLNFIFVVFPDLRASDPIFFWLFLCMAVLVGMLGVFAFGIPNILMDKEFRFTIYEDRVVCASPSRLFGPSYSIMLGEIKDIVEESSADGLNNWYIVTTDGRQHKITYSYGNPARKIANILLVLKQASDEHQG